MLQQLCRCVYTNDAAAMLSRATRSRRVLVLRGEQPQATMEQRRIVHQRLCRKHNLETFAATSLPVPQDRIGNADAKSSACSNAACSPRPRAELARVHLLCRCAALSQSLTLKTDGMWNWLIS